MSEHAGVDERVREVDLALATQSCEQLLMQALPHARLLPLGKAPPASDARAKAELLGQVAPGDSGVQHEHLVHELCRIRCSRDTARAAVIDLHIEKLPDRSTS